MKPASAWTDELRGIPGGPAITLVPCRDNDATIKAGPVYLHSRYNPREEAARLIDSAHLDPARPVLVLGSGLGYHVLELARRGFEVAVAEPDPVVAKLAVEHLLGATEILLGIGDPDALASDPVFAAFARRMPQVLAHPASERLHGPWVAHMAELTARAALDHQRLRVAVVGPMYGGSLPIAGYLERAFRSLGHVTTFIDNSTAWPLYQAATEGRKAKNTSRQLGDMLAHFLGEWSYARAAEFMPDICIVMAQAPVAATFPARLAKDGVITAFWYVENWRHFPYWQHVAPQYDCFFHIQPGEFEQELTKAGCPLHAYVPTGCDPDIHRPVSLTLEEQVAYGCDVSFAGAGYPNRVQMFKGLTDYNFRIWGVDWNALELQPLVRRPDERFTPEDFARIVAGSKISLNLHSSVISDGVDPKADAVNPRVFEIAACGGFQLCDPCAGLEGLFDSETELPVYHTLPELRRKLDHFLAHPDERAAIARRARERALAEHTYRHRAQRMLDVILQHHGARILRKGIRIQRTMAEMTEQAGPDSSLGRYLATLPPDTLFTQENINPLLPIFGTPMSPPEQFFSYLREVRNFAEGLLAGREP